MFASSCCLFLLLCFSPFLASSSSSSSSSSTSWYQNFLKTNNLELLVRSHEVKDDGYEIEHNDQLITVFSAPNYVRANSTRETEGERQTRQGTKWNLAHLLMRVAH